MGSPHSGLQRLPSPEISPVSRELARFAAFLAPLWTESRSRSYGLKEEQARASENPPESG